MKIRNMKLILNSDKFDNCKCNFKLKSKGPQAPSWFMEFVNDEFKPLVKEVKSINERIDHLVKVNNLKE